MRHIRCRFWPTAFGLLSVAKSFGKSKGRSEKGRFLALPHALLKNPDFKSLSGSALKVLIHVGSQYNGKNNGDLSATLVNVRASGVRSSSTLAAAIAELLQKNLIICTRAGRFMKPGGRCALYVITWMAVDDCQGKELEHPPTAAPLRALSLETAKDPVRKAN